MIYNLVVIWTSDRLMLWFKDESKWVPAISKYGSVGIRKVRFLKDETILVLQFYLPVGFPFLDLIENRSILIAHSECGRLDNPHTANLIAEFSNCKIKRKVLSNMIPLEYVADIVKLDVFIVANFQWLDKGTIGEFYV